MKTRFCYYANKYAPSKTKYKNIKEHYAQNADEDSGPGVDIIPGTKENPPKLLRALDERNMTMSSVKQELQR